VKQNVQTCASIAASTSVCPGIRTLTRVSIFLSFSQIEKATTILTHLQFDFDLDHSYEKDPSPEQLHQHPHFATLKFHADNLMNV
jgi:hypothetical protein